VSERDATLGVDHVAVNDGPRHEVGCATRGGGDEAPDVVALERRDEGDLGRPVVERLAADDALHLEVPLDGGEGPAERADLYDETERLVSQG